MSTKVKQRDITDCGAACLASVASHYKLEMPVARIRQIAGTDTKGTNVLGMVKAAEKLGFSAKGVKGNQESLAKIPLPSIAHIVIERNELVLHHYVVIYKIKNDNITYMDPADGEMHTFAIEEFMKQWSGVLILLIPDDDFVEENEKVSNFKRFVFLLAPHKSVLTQSLTGAIFYTILGLSTSIYIQKITDNVLPTGNFNLLNLLSVGMLIIILFQILLGTTLAFLLQKLYPLNSGKIKINNVDINHFSHESMRAIVGTIPQQLNLFSGNIIDNIAVGDLQPDMDRILSITQQLGLVKFIDKLPNGFNTQIGENGASLSGGEKQRLAIARALYKNPEILVFDEATSSLDSESEQYVKSMIQTLKKQGKTILIIAHRLSTVIDADKIAILENGILIEEGNHHSLYKEKTKYYQMWKKQLPGLLSDIKSIN